MKDERFFKINKSPTGIDFKLFRRFKGESDQVELWLNDEDIETVCENGLYGGFLAFTEDCLNDTYQETN